MSGNGMGSRRAWESEAENWISWAREPGHDDYWSYSPAFFRDIVPPPVGRTLEIGCGEGRVTRDLQRLGHDTFAVDTSPALLRAARDLDADGRYVLADAGQLPFDAGTFGLVVAYNSLMDVDDMPRAVAEASRVLRPNGRMCICVTHPMADAGRFADRSADAPFVIAGDYLGTRIFDDSFERDGLTIRFYGYAYPLEAYARALEAADLLIETLREPPQRDERVESDPAEARWQRLPTFLFVRAVMR
jgi:SAM-dependent methyltransferase